MSFFICLLLKLDDKETKARELLYYPNIKNGGFKMENEEQENVVTQTAEEKTEKTEGAVTRNCQ